MSVLNQQLDTPASQFVLPTSRYIGSKVQVWGEHRAITFETYKRRPIPNRDEDRFTTIPPGEEFRPDKTSYRAYRTPDYWWYVMEANGIHDILDFKAGTNIRLPVIQ